MSPTSIALLAIVLYIFRRAYKLSALLQTNKSIPKYICLFNPFSPIHALLPHGSWNPGVSYAWEARHTLYKEIGSEIVMFIPLLFGEPALLCSSPEVLKDALSDVSVFVKPAKALALDFMGPNVVASVGEQWRRHRKITAPAFDNQSYANVWEVTSLLYYQMVESDFWKSSDEHLFRSFGTQTKRLAVLVFAACGFNMQIGWNESPLKEGYTTPLDSIIVTTASNMFERMLLPEWVFDLPFKWLRHMKTSFDEMERLLRSEVAAKKVEIEKDLQLDGTISNRDKNIFGRIVAASHHEGSAKGLDEREITGNLFIFLFAGHETTAHTILVTLALLAIHQKEQERVAKYIRTVCDGREPSFEDYNALAPVLHCFYEALRIYPAAYLLPRVATENVVLSAPNLLPATGDTLTIPQGAEFCLDLVGACYNPRHYPNPGAFIPTRWEDTSATSLDTFVAFSSGPRVCLGKKFASVEAVCFLTLLLRDFTVGVKLEGEETAQEWQARILKPTFRVNMTMGDVPLVFTRRPL